MPLSNPIAVIPSGNDILAKLQQHLGVWWFNSHWLPPEMLVNFLGGTGTVEWNDYHVDLLTGGDVGSYAWVLKDCYGLSGQPSWDKKKYFGVYVYFQTIATQYIHLASGNISTPTGIDDARRRIGFKVNGAVLYGVAAKGTGESTLELATLAGSVFRRLECIFIPGVECRFYVDGVDKGALDTNLPSGTLEAECLMVASIYNTEAAAKSFKLFVSRTFQEE